MQTQYTVRNFIFCLALLVPSVEATAQIPDPGQMVLLVPDAIWDGTQDAVKKGFVVLVKGSRIEAVGLASEVKAPQDAERVELPGTTLIPGLIVGHSHLFLHPYSEKLWDDQVLKEPLGFRMVAAVAHARSSLL